MGILGALTPVLLTTAAFSDSPGQRKKAASPTPDRPIRFARDIRPLLSDKCFRCHGPDGGARRADLRLDTEEGAFRDRGGSRPFVPGKPEKSQAYLRITAANPALRMPPPTSNLTLT